MKMDMRLLRSSVCSGAVALLALSKVEAMGQFGLPSIGGKPKPTSVTLVTQLPPIAIPVGTTVQLQTTMADKTMPPQAAEMLKQEIRSLLLSSKASNLQLVEGPADMVMKCTVTSYEPKVVHPTTTQEGMTTVQVATWEGNMAVSVQVVDRQGRALDAANLKNHQENDYILGKKEGKVISVFGKIAGTERAAEMLNLAHGGSVGEMAQALGAGTALGQALNISQARNQPQPTDTQWSSALIEGMAVKVANRIVPVTQGFIASLPAQKEFDEIRTLAMANHWGEVQERAEKMPQQKPPLEADRLYLIGLSYEALANSNPTDAQAAADLLNKATKYYGDAHLVRPTDHNLTSAQLRAADSLDHYLEVQHYLEAKNTPQNPAPKPPTPPGPTPPNSTGTGSMNAADNNALIEMVKAGVPESVILTFVRTTGDPKFDDSAPGLVALGHGGVPASVITAVQQRMAKPAPGKSSPVRRAR